jgi:hypothetical protein
MNSWVLETNQSVRILENELLTPGASIILSQLHPELILEPVFEVVVGPVLELAHKLVIEVVINLVIALVLELFP